MDDKWIKIGTFIIAVIALIQPWIIYIWNKFLKSAEINFYETGRIEVGFSDYCTSIGVNGTLRALNRDIYVKNMQVEIIRKRDSSKHLLEWGVFRDSKINLNNPEDIKIELPGGFLLSKEIPKKINVQFHDLKQQEEISPTYSTLQDSWNNFLDTNYPVQQQLADSPEEYRIKKGQIYDNFRQTQIVTDAYSSVDRNFYLEPGEYELKLYVYTSKPDKKFVYKWDFSLEEQESQHVRLNVVRLTDHACNQFQGNWNFAYPRFE